MNPPTPRTVITALAVLVLILVVIIAYLLIKPQFSAPGSLATSTPPVSSNTPVSPSTATQALHITEHAPYYDIDMQYPASTPLAKSISATADSSAVQTMKAFEEDTIATFKKDGNFANLTPQDIQTQGLDRGEKYALSAKYHAYSGAGTVSYLFTIVEDTLGAHPNAYYKSFTFDENIGKQLSLSDLFLPDSNYLSILSTLSRKSLVKQLGANGNETDFIDPGTTPTADNFATFAIDGNNLVLFFPPYQVAAYAFGPQSVRIPLSQLSNVLKSVYSPR